MNEKWFIVDAHQHAYLFWHSDIYPPELSKLSNEEILDMEVKRFREWFKRYNVSYGVVCAYRPRICRIWKSRHGGNEALIELIKRLNGKLVGYYSPNVFEPSDLVREKVEEAIRELGFKGIKLHPWVSAFPLNHPMVYPIFDVAAKYRIPVLSHSSRSEFCTPLLFADITMRYPEVPVIMGHMGKQHLHYDVLPVMRLAENIYLETSGSKLQVLLEKVIEEFGAERVLFGTDGPHELLSAYVARIEDLNISEEEKEKILGKNAAKLFGLSFT